MYKVASITMVWHSQPKSIKLFNITVIKRLYSFQLNIWVLLTLFLWIFLQNIIRCFTCLWKNIKTQIILNCYKHTFLFILLWKKTMRNNTKWKLNNRITLTSGNMSWKYVGIHESNTKKQLFWQACPITQDLKVIISGHKADKKISLRLLCCTYKNL